MYNVFDALVFKKLLSTLQSTNIAEQTACSRLPAIEHRAQLGYTKADSLPFREG